MRSPLEQARGLLDGSVDVRSHSVRAAGWLARAELEDVLVGLILAKGADPGRSSVRTRLCCIEVLYRDSPDVAGKAQFAWDSLSQAAHHHSYDLGPTHAEVAAAVELVADLRARAALRD